MAYWRFALLQHYTIVDANRSTLKIGTVGLFYYFIGTLGIASWYSP